MANVCALSTSVVTVSVSVMPSVEVTQAVLVMTVPSSNGLSTSTTSVTLWGTPMFSVPRSQVMRSLASGPVCGCVAVTKLVLTGMTSVMITPVALTMPPLVTVRV